MKNSPSAFIPFCEYNGDMLAVGEHIDTFPFPVCTAFRPTVLQGQLCYMFDPDSVKANITSGDHSLLFLLDYNEDREYSTLEEGKIEKEQEPLTMSKMGRNDDENNEGMIYIHTLGNLYPYKIYTIRFRRVWSLIVCQVQFLQLQWNLD